MHKGIAAGRVQVRGKGHQASLFQLLQGRHQLLGRALYAGLQQVEREFNPDHGRHIQHLAALRAHATQALAQQHAQAAGDRQSIQPVQTPGVGGQLQQGLDRLDQKLGIAACAAQQVGDQVRRGNLVKSGQNQLTHGRLIQGSQVEYDWGMLGG